MKAFARLLDRLAFLSSRNAKLALLAAYFRETPDPDRGIALAALTGDLQLRTAKPKLIRDLVTERVDPELFGWSYDFVGDLAETAALIWPTGERNEAAVPGLAAAVDQLNRAHKDSAAKLVAEWLDVMDPAERWALLKLITGALRVGVSARLARTALADYGAVEVGAIEEVWHALTPPYAELFAWLDGRGPLPETRATPTFRPLMLANPLDEAELAKMQAADYRAEWKWDGIRVQLVAVRDAQGARVRRVYSRTGDDISTAFPDVVEALDFEAVLDGELLVVRDGQAAPFADLQQRLGRKRVSAKMLQSQPAHVRLYDMLFDGEEDLRALPLDARRGRLEHWYGAADRPRLDLSPLLDFESWEELADLRAGAREAGIEGLMLKRADSPYLAGRPKGPWFKWKRDPLLVDAVLMYAQRGHGKRSSFYSDYTFGCWRRREGRDELVPVGKAYFGFTDEELGQLDRWVRAHTTQRFGPVREVEQALVFEVAFDAVQRSTRHKSGIAMRFPRISRIRWDKPAAEADWLPTLEAMIEGARG